MWLCKYTDIEQTSLSKVATSDGPDFMISQIRNPGSEKIKVHVFDWEGFVAEAVVGTTKVHLPQLPMQL